MSKEFFFLVDRRTSESCNIYHERDKKNRDRLLLYQFITLQTREETKRMF